MSHCFIGANEHFYMTDTRHPQGQRISQPITSKARAVILVQALADAIHQLDPDTRRRLRYHAEAKTPVVCGIKAVQKRIFTDGKGGAILEFLATTRGIPRQKISFSSATRSKFQEAFRVNEALNEGLAKEFVIYTLDYLTSCLCQPDIRRAIMLGTEGVGRATMPHGQGIGHWEPKRTAIKRKQKLTTVRRGT